MLNFARGIMYIGTGLAFGAFALFIVTISNSWTERMTETLILWGGILTFTVVLTIIIVVIYRVNGNRQNGDVYYEDAPSRRSSSRSTALAPMGGGNGQPSIIFVQPNGAGGRQDAIYGYGQQPALAPPPQGSFDYSSARYELEF